MATPEVQPPYVVTADGYKLLHAWAKPKGARIPSQEYFADYTADLIVALSDATATSVEVVEHLELEEGLASLVSKSTLTVISLDRAYTEDNEHIAGHLDATRTVDPSFIKKELSNRPGTPSLYDQLEVLRTTEPTPVTLLDDVIYSGESILTLAKLLEAVGRPVQSVIAGVAIRKGVEIIEAAGIEVRSVRFYPDVYDEVCQRDFFACLPFAGRTVIAENNGSQTTYSAPYFRPFGHPEDWATIKNHKVSEFSKFCLKYSLDLWDEVFDRSGMHITTHEVPRPLKGMADRIEPVTHFLNRHLTRDKEVITNRGG